MAVLNQRLSGSVPQDTYEIPESEYDLPGGETARIDALGRRTEMEYDVFGRQVTTTC